ncbi:MAG: DUF4412 domain-containing protein [Polyangiales bacterium]
MRTLVPFIVMFIAIAVSTPALAFEGEIQFRGTDAASAGFAAMTVLIAKNGDVSMEMMITSRDGAMRKVGYLKPSTGRYNYMLDHRRRLALQVPKDTFDKAPIGPEPDTELDLAKLEVEKLGPEEVGGQTTRHIRIIDKDTGDITELWLSDKYSAQLWSQAMGFGGDGPSDPIQDWNKAAAKLGFKPGFPMRVVNKGRQGAESGIEVAKIAEHKVDSKSFSPPQDYEIQEMHISAGGVGDIPVKAPTTREEHEKMRDELMK